MASKDVAAILGKDFVTLKLDWDRQAGAKDLIKPSDGGSPGLPWFAFLDGDGKVVIDSIAPSLKLPSGNAVAGNIGFPAKDDEYAHFQTMVEKVRRHITGDELAKLIAAMEAINKKTT